MRWPMLSAEDEFSGLVRPCEAVPGDDVVELGPFLPERKYCWGSGVAERRVGSLYARRMASEVGADTDMIPSSSTDDIAAAFAATVALSAYQASVLGLSFVA